MRVQSSDGVHVALHDLGGTGRPILLSHATGFHGHCYAPIADALADRFHATALDYRGHGETEAPADWDVRWEGYGDDAHAAARAVAPDGALVAFGHSMGGACLLMAAHRDPALFDLLVVFEPIVFPPLPPDDDPDAERPGNALAEGARRRRARFDSVQHAFDNYASKPPLGAFTPDALRAYVEHGTIADGDGVRLRCDPEHEARTFEMGGTHGTWDLLPEIETPVVVMAGRADAPGPAERAPLIAERLANARFVQLDHLDHFGPMTHPDEIAQRIERAVDELTAP